MIFNRPVWIRSHCLFSVQMWCPMHYRCRVHCQRETLKTAARDAQAWRRGQPNLNWVWLFTLHGWNCKSLWLHLKEMRLVSFTSSSSIYISISLWFNTYLKQNFVMEHLKYFFAIRAINRDRSILFKGWCLFAGLMVYFSNFVSKSSSPPALWNHMATSHVVSTPISISHTLN